MTIKVKMDEIESIFMLLIQRAKNDWIEVIDLETDYYWVITTDEWDDFKSDPSPKPVVGSLYDDWESLKKILSGEHIVTYLDYERFASILRAISETIAPSKRTSVENEDT